jgi:hypothetical protein
MRYIEVVAGRGVCRYDFELTDEELRRIGKFTRENITKWLEHWDGPENVPVDFHAVCDDIEIPWATEEGCDHYRRVMELAAANGKGEK